MLDPATLATNDSPHFGHWPAPPPVIGDIPVLPTTADAGSAEGQQPDLTLIVPTRNEADNIPELVRRLAAFGPDLGLEVLFVDDSDDGTPAAIETARRTAPMPIRLVHRPAGQRLGGLGGAVTVGLREARAPWACVMDADLQHPPELIPDLVDRAVETGADLVVASRYCGGGEAAGFGLIRAAVSQGSTAAARLLFPRRLRGVSDPMSGFFMVRRSALEIDRLRPCGFKILLEIIGRTKGLAVAEVPFEFGERHAGQSKASLREGVRYLRLLLGLRFGDATMRFARFGVVGLSGLLINTLVLSLATEVLGLFYLLSAIVATQGSTLWNFALTEGWVFSERTHRRGRSGRAVKFFAMNNAALALRGPMLFVLTSSFGLHYLASNLITLVALMVIRFGTADRFIWGRLSARDLVAAGDLVPQFPGAVPVTAGKEGG